MSVIETRRHQMFPVLDAAQIETARRFASGPPRTFKPGEIMFDVGERGLSILARDRGLDRCDATRRAQKRGVDHDTSRRTVLPESSVNSRDASRSLRDAREQTAAPRSRSMRHIYGRS
jgi:hypothetical protein